MSSNNNESSRLENVANSPPIPPYEFSHFVQSLFHDRTEETQPPTNSPNSPSTRHGQPGYSESPVNRQPRFMHAIAPLAVLFTFILVLNLHEQPGYKQLPTTATEMNEAAIPIPRPQTDAKEIERQYFEITYNITVLEYESDLSIDSEIKDRKPFSLNAIPALFGTIFPKHPHHQTIPLLIPENNKINGCRPFSIDFPELTEHQSRLLSPKSPISETDADLISRFDANYKTAKPKPRQQQHADTKWLVLLPRGSCPFDMKIYHAQMAGFYGAIIYNLPTKPDEKFDDTPVRMAANTLDDEIEIWAMFVTRRDGLKLKTHHRRGESNVIMVSLESTRYDVRSVNIFTILRESSYDMIAVSLLLVSATFTLIWVVVMIGHAYGGMYFQVFQEGGRRRMPTLKTVDLPLKIVTEKDLEAAKNAGVEALASCGGGEWMLRSGDCCAICIDNFGMGDGVRILPCQHQFHDICIDPWLMKHNRLCPICKQDVLKFALDTRNAGEYTYDAPRNVILQARQYLRNAATNLFQQLIPRQN